METTAQQPKRMIPFRRTQGGVARGLPIKPRFLREIVVAPCNNGIVADGTGRFVVLQGNATKVLIPDLIRLMDGTRTIDELYSALDTVPEQDVRAAISALTHSGLVADSGETVEEVAEANRDSLSFLERFISVANHTRNGVEAYSRLQSSNIALISAGRSTERTERLANLLTSTGAGSVTCFAPEGWRQLQSNIEKLPTNSLVVVLSFTPEDRQLGRLIDECCEQLHLSWLRVGLDESGTSFDIGPLFGAKRSAESPFLIADVHVPRQRLVRVRGHTLPDVLGVRMRIADAILVRDDDEVRADRAPDRLGDGLDGLGWLRVAHRLDDVGRRGDRVRDREGALLVLIVDLRRNERVRGESADDHGRGDDRDLQEQQLGRDGERPQPAQRQ